MGKAFHKPTPSPPYWYWYDSDCCWWCKYRNNQKGCTNCKVLKKLAAEQKRKQNKNKKLPIDFL